MKKVKQLPKVSRTRAHRVLFDNTLPFRARREPSPLHYTRKVKHAHRETL